MHLVVLMGLKASSKQPNALKIHFECITPIQYFGSATAVVILGGHDSVVDAADHDLFRTTRISNPHHSLMVIQQHEGSF